MSLRHNAVWDAVHDQIPRAIRESHRLEVWEDAGVMFGKLITHDGSKYFTFVLDRGLIPEHVVLQLCVVA